ncbi:MAG: ArsR/SmtB family transcription factor [Gaiellaceae bacterium]
MTRPTQPTGEGLGPGDPHLSAGGAPFAVAHPLPDDLIELIAERFRVLSEPTRIKLLDRLREGEATVVELTDLTGTTQQNVSKHLGVLQRAGIVARRKQGNFAHYRIVDEGVFSLCEAVCGSLQQRVESLRQLVEAATPPTSPSTSPIAKPEGRASRAALTAGPGF